MRRLCDCQAASTLLGIWVARFSFQLLHFCLATSYGGIYCQFTNSKRVKFLPLKYTFPKVGQISSPSVSRRFHEFPESERGNTHGRGCLLRLTAARHSCIPHRRPPTSNLSESPNYKKALVHLFVCTFPCLP
ncbi:hypothetical protein QBC38DRAFT_178270 [Podospora fimiseda]|uniref:Uncharacterized protein n=1 Tax=Podospora fimiseda TaxID=252190 RepID=A0AAN7H4N4_9PEZI|nr:hypothetical protein QBC38DRAFT_178270 [Podospora fimiseda]